MCKREGRGREDVWGGPIPDFRFGQKCLLLGVHVQQQVSNTVAVAKLVVIPKERQGEVGLGAKVNKCQTLFSAKYNKLVKMIEN